MVYIRSESVPPGGAANNWPGRASMLRRRRQLGQRGWELLTHHHRAGCTWSFRNGIKHGRPSTRAAVVEGLLRTAVLAAAVVRLARLVAARSGEPVRSFMVERRRREWCISNRGSALGHHRQPGQRQCHTDRRPAIAPPQAGSGSGRSVRASPGSDAVNHGGGGSGGGKGSSGNAGRYVDQGICATTYATSAKIEYHAIG